MQDTFTTSRRQRRQPDTLSSGAPIVGADFAMEAVWASSAEEVRAAQRLRHRVFADEMGARLAVPPGTPPGHDADRFDDYCDHLIVRVTSPFDRLPRVVGTYRVLTPEGARRAGGWYSETEFDLAPLAAMRPRMAELGRSCIDPAWRKGGTILTLWAALGEFMLGRGLDVAFGCASVSLGDGGHAAADLWHQLARTHLAPAEHRVRPWNALPLEGLGSGAAVETPALIRGYLRCGAVCLGPPAIDTDFGTADVPMLMTLAGLPQRHKRHFLGEGAALAAGGRNAAA